MLASVLPDCWPINVPALCSGSNVLDILYALRIIIILLHTYLPVTSLPSQCFSCQPTYIHCMRYSCCSALALEFFLHALISVKYALSHHFIDVSLNIVPSSLMRHANHIFRTLVKTLVYALVNQYFSPSS